MKKMCIRVKDGRLSKTVSFPIHEDFENWMINLSKRKKSLKEGEQSDETFIAAGDSRIKVEISICNFGEIF